MARKTTLRSLVPFMLTVIVIFNIVLFGGQAVIKGYQQGQQKAERCRQSPALIECSPGGPNIAGAR